MSNTLDRKKMLQIERQKLKIEIKNGILGDFVEHLYAPGERTYDELDAYVRPREKRIIEINKELRKINREENKNKER